jgi:hypothetical protein
MTKLTLSIDKTVIEKAKQLAEANQTSVSAMFSQFVQSMAGRHTRPGKIGPLTRKATGMLKLPPGKDYRDLLTEALQDKYGAAE